MAYNNTIKSLLACLLLCNFFLVNAAESDSKYPDVSDQVIVTSDNWCPYTCMTSAESPGILYDMVKAVLDHADKKFQYKQASWQRAIDMVDNDKAHILVGVNPALAKKVGFNIFPEFHLDVESAFMVHKSIKNNQFTEAEFMQLKVGYMEKYQYDETGHWDELLHRHPKSIAVENHLGETHLITLLKKGRIDAAMINVDLANHYLEEWGIGEDYRYVHMDIHIPVYIAFNQSDIGLNVMQMFKQEFSVVSADGTFEELMTKYQADETLTGLAARSLAKHKHSKTH